MCLKPKLSIMIAIEMEMKNASGQMVMTVNFTPDNLCQRHEFKFDLDQSYLPNAISGCREVLSKYPLKGSQTAESLVERRAVRPWSHEHRARNAKQEDGF